jgi:hypothetical protein
MCRVSHRYSTTTQNPEKALGLHACLHLSSKVLLWENDLEGLDGMACTHPLVAELVARLAA